MRCFDLHTCYALWEEKIAERDLLSRADLVFSESYDQLREQLEEQKEAQAVPMPTVQIHMRL